VDIQSLLNETMGLLRETIMTQAQQTVEIEKDLAKLKADCENVKENQRTVFKKIDDIMGAVATMQETFRNYDTKFNDLMTEYKEQRKDMSSLSLTVAKKIGEITAIIAIIYAIIQYTGR